MDSAKNLQEGFGLLIDGKPMTHYPPVYPILLYLISIITNGDIFIAGQLLCAILFGTNLVLFCYVALLSTDWNLLAGISAFLMFSFSDQNIYVHSMALSEAPFIMFSLAAIIFLTLFIDNNSINLLLLSSLMAGLAIATRYIGVSLIPVFVITLILYSKGSMKLKLRNS